MTTESLSGTDNPAAEQGMTGGMLDYDNNFTEMLAADRPHRCRRCRTNAMLMRIFILAPTAAHWLFLLWSLDSGYTMVTDSHNGTHKIHIGRTHTFAVRARAACNIPHRPNSGRV